MKKKFELTDKHKKIAVIVSVIIFIFLTVVIAVFVGRPLVKFASKPELFREWVDSNGIFSRLAFLGMNMLQVVIAIIPGEPFELAAGYAFGKVEGTLLCVLGATLGGVPIFWLVRKLGVKAVEIFFSKEKIESLKFLKSSPKRDILVFIFYLIPGTPKDLLNYFVGLTDMKFWKWLIISLVARFPSIITSTVGGDAVGLKNYTFAIVVFAITLVISGIGIFIYRRICRVHSHDGEDKEKDIN